jgi:hypothetical protein
MSGHSAKSAASKVAAALVVVFAAGLFFYANHSTVASFTAKPLGSENALPAAPAVSGIDSAYELLW